MGKCKICGDVSQFISSFLGVCRKCIVRKTEEALSIASTAHEKARKKFGLPPTIPKTTDAPKCFGCGNECQIPNGGRGFCGLVINKDNKLVRLAGIPNKGLLEWYYDGLPTNCVAIEFCPAGTGCGYPKFAMSDGPEYGFYNLSVFYGACNFDCLFCQNWHFKNLTSSLEPLISAQDLADKVREDVTCICFFGGTPDPQLPHAIEVARLARENKNGILRVCLESNGNSNWTLLKKFAKISLESGGCIKFDLKFFDENLNLALTGVSNKVTLRNFKKLSSLHKKRPEVPFLIASTLLIPGYVTVEEVGKIAEFIAGLDSTIPYNLLAFYPHFMMTDLPFTSRRFAEKCYKTAKEKGLERVRLGNIHLLS